MKRRVFVSAAIGGGLTATGAWLANSETSEFRVRSTIGAQPTTDQYLSQQIPLSGPACIQSVIITDPNRIRREELTDHLRNALPEDFGNGFLTAIILISDTGFTVDSYRLSGELIHYTIQYQPGNRSRSNMYHYAFQWWSPEFPWSSPPQKIGISVKN